MFVLEICLNPQKIRQVVGSRGVWTEKKIFGCWFQFFCEWHHK